MALQRSLYLCIGLKGRLSGDNMAETMQLCRFLWNISTCFLDLGRQEVNNYPPLMPKFSLKYMITEP
jgi:hypothetical protein